MNWLINCDTCVRASPSNCCACGIAVRSASDWRASVRCCRATSASACALLAPVAWPDSACEASPVALPVWAELLEGGADCELDGLLCVVWAGSVGVVELAVVPVIDPVELAELI